MRTIILLASLYNIAAGIGIIFLLHLDFVANGFGINVAAGPEFMLFRLFVGGTTITLGIGYLNVFRNPSGSPSILVYGAGLKYWAFLISIYCWYSYGLSIAGLILFGLANLAFAVSFTIYLSSRRSGS